MWHGVVSRPNVLVLEGLLGHPSLKTIIFTICVLSDWSFHLSGNFLIGIGMVHLISLGLVEKFVCFFKTFIFLSYLSQAHFFGNPMFFFIFTNFFLSIFCLGYVQTEE
jgi:uncharacterized protein YjeT (DUF2065 family)